MPTSLRAAVLPARDPESAAAFWATLLGRRVVADDHGWLVPGEDAQLGLRLVAGPEVPAGSSRVHVHLTSSSPADQRDVVATALDLGAEHLDVGQRPEEGHVVLADPAGTSICVIEPGNSFLAGCGRLGELACDGNRRVGVFWSAALGWPLVWDQDEQTAVQSPKGGTKIAWGGPPVLPVRPEDPPLFDLVTDGDLEAEVARLVGLGATRRDKGAAGVVLADPDGVLLRVSRG